MANSGVFAITTIPQFSDAARLLGFYQLWLDDLYPRAKFADCLSMIEKLGHSKRIQIIRRQWIDERKPQSCCGDSNGQGSQAVLANTLQGSYLNKANHLEDGRHTEILNDVNFEQVQSILNNRSDKMTTVQDPMSVNDAAIFVADGDRDRDVVEGRLLGDDLDALLAEEDVRMVKVGESMILAPESESRDHSKTDIEARLDDGW